ncbi:MAG: hypothetical protein DHS20C02_16310 [Micavibrio sp.]|nr:MAG: hypothetical protein DHS20C02_16310 [Micavibrio sp.]
MDIDLLFTPEGESGLISGGNLVQKVAGVIFSLETGILSLEFLDMDYLDLNIPVEKDFHSALDFSNLIHVGAYSKDHIAQAYQVPFMIADDPYRAEAGSAGADAGNPLLAFEAFIKRCKFGQPVHREDLGDEDKMGCLLGDAVPSSLEFAPHLARRRSFEAAPKLAPGNVPGLGLGTSGGGGGAVSRGTSKKDPKDSE